jgi:hypothetical protein
MKHLFSALLLCASANLAVADLPPIQRFWSDTTEPPRNRAVKFVQASSQDLYWAFSNTVNSAHDLTNVTSVLFTYTPTDHSWSVVTTGEVYNVPTATCRWRFTPTSLNTNGTFDWIIQIYKGTTQTLAQAYGTLTLVEDPTAGVTNSLPLVTTIDWSRYIYQYTTDEGPIRVTGLSCTTNDDGSVTYAIGNILGNYVLTTTYNAGTNTLQTAIDLKESIANVNTKTGQTYNAATAYADSLAPNYATAAQGVSATDAQARVAIVETNTVLRDGSKTLTGPWNVGNQSITNAGLFQSVVGFGMPTIDMGGGLYRYGWAITTESGGAGEEYGAYINAPWRTPYRLTVGDNSGGAMRFGKREIGYGELGAYDLTDPDIDIARYEGWALGRPAGVTTQLTLRIRQGSFRFGVGGSTNGEDTVFGYWDSDGWDWAGYRLRKTGWPTATNDAANKAYVDAGTNTLQVAITAANTNADARVPTVTYTAGTNTLQTDISSRILRAGDTMTASLKGPNATETNDYVTLDDLASALGGLSVLYASTNRTLTNGYYDARTFMPTHSNSTISVGSVTTGQYLAQWASNTGIVTTLRHGIAVITSRQRITTTSGGRSLTVKPELYLLYADGTIPELLETSQTISLNATMTDYETSIDCPTNVMVPSDARIVIKWKATAASATTPTWEFMTGSNLVIACRLPTASPLAVNAVDQTARDNATNAQARCTLLEKTPLVVPFIATNVAYETAWIMRPISDQTITQIIAKCDVGTGAVWFVTQSLTDGWRTFSTTNAISVSTTGDYYTTAMTTTNGTMFGYQYKGGTCTQGVFFVYSQ